jgi:hypothetical protein
MAVIAKELLHKAVHRNETLYMSYRMQMNRKIRARAESALAQIADFYFPDLDR